MWCYSILRVQIKVPPWQEAAGLCLDRAPEAAVGASGLGSCCRVCVAPELELLSFVPRRLLGHPCGYKSPRAFLEGCSGQCSGEVRGFFFSVAVLEHRLCCTQTELRELPLLLLSAKAGCLEHPSDPGQ